ncbi:MAG: PleD family two-component system response regulator [Sulfitobacter sp.]
MRVLAVDDDPQILQTLPAVFRQARLRDIELANSGAAALRLLNDPDEHFDVLLLDIKMPQMDGIELCRRIRNLKRYRATPIIMLTSSAHSPRIERAFAAGADDYLTKPFDVREIVMRVRVAERMAKRRSKIHIIDPICLRPDVREGEHPFKNTDPLRISHVERLILPFSLGNYLSQLSRRQLNTCSIFSVRLMDVGLLYASAKTHEFAYALSMIVDGIAKVVECPRMLMAYEGEGSFLCITQAAVPFDWPDVEYAIQDQLDAHTLPLENGWPMGLTVAVGNPVTPNASSNQRVKRTFDRARERAIHREQSKGRQAIQTRHQLHAENVEDLRA